MCAPKLIDALSGKVVAEANLIGRSKATNSRGAKHVSARGAKALGKWLNTGGLKKEKGGEKDAEVTTFPGTVVMLAGA